MHDQSTGVLTVDDVIRAHPGPLTEGPAGEWHGACPLCGGKDRWWTRQHGPKLVIQCRQAECGATFPDHLAALGFDVAGAMVPPLMPAAPVPPRETGRWQCVNPVTGQLADHVRIEPGRTGRDKDVIWEPAGAKSKEMIWPPTYQPTPGPLVVTEGEKVAQAAVERLGLDAIGTCCGCSATPTLGALTACKGRDVILSPDNDTGGHAHMKRIAALLEGVAASVRILDSHQLPDAEVVDKWDLADWNPSDSVDVLGAVEAASRNPVDLAPPTPARVMRLLLADDDDTEKPKPLIPGLVWEGCVSLITSAPKSGKTTLIADGLSRLFTGEAWLSERCEGDRSLPILIWQEMPIGILRAWVRRHGVARDAPIYAAPMETVEQVLETVEKLKPQAIVIDSLTDLSAASDAGDMWRGSDMRKLIKGLRSSGCAALIVHHVRKSDGAARDSSDITAAVDMIVSFDGGARSGEAPPDGQTRRRLTYRGRWQEEARQIDYDQTTGRYTLATGPADDGGGGGGSLVPGTGTSRLDEEIGGYLMKHQGGVSGRDVCKAIAGRDGLILKRLKAVGAKGQDRLWRVLPDAADPYVGQHRQHRCPEVLPTPMPIDRAAPAAPLPVVLPSKKHLRRQHPSGSTLKRCPRRATGSTR